MGNVEKLERKTKDMQEAIKVFEKDAAKEYMNLEREETSPVGYWYVDANVNTAFKWFLSGTSYGKLIERLGE